MKKIVFVMFLLCLPFIGYSQFKIKGIFEGYNNEPVIIKVYENGIPKFLTKLQTDANGVFTYKFPMSYRGLLLLETGNKTLQLISNNTDINFKTEGKSQNGKIEFTGGINSALSDYDNYKTLLNIKNKMFPALKSMYESNQGFYKAIIKESERIEKLKPKNIQDEELAYYINTQDTIENYNNGVNPQKIVKSTLKHLTQDDLRLENLGFLPTFVQIYLMNSARGANSREEAKKRIEVASDNLLKEVGEETARGQSILLTIINLLNASEFKDLSKKYINKAEDLTCEINPSLKFMLKNKDNVAVGKKVPNIVFDEKIKGAKSLYDIKANKKLLIFWGSWCGHCQHEWPFIKAFYPEFKKQGGEIITFAVDLEKHNILPFINGTDWYNYSDFLKWDSPIIKEYGITGTPTMILLDKDNKVIKTGSRVAEFSNFK